MILSELVKDIVNDIILNLSDRRGLGQEWEQIDSEIQEEIKECWGEIIQNHLAKG